LSGHPISRRGKKATQTELRADFDIFFEAKDDLWHKEHNPNGKFPVNMAENNLCWDLMNKKINDILNHKSMPSWVPNYTGISGQNDFKETLAKFLSTYITKCTINPNHIAVSAGATAVIELASWITCNENDVAVIPAPSYPVYTQDINNKSAVDRYNLITHHHLTEIQNGSLLHTAVLESSTKTINQNGQVFKLLLLTNPDNPTGLVYNKDQLESIAEWCHTNEIHLLVNELYALSLIQTDHPELKQDYPDPLSFSSFGPIIQKYNSPYLHLAYGLSKDFGISGFRVGLIYTLNENFLTAYKNLNAPHMVSNITQWICHEVLSDQQFIEQYIIENQKRLTENYIIAVSKLRTDQIPYIPAIGSLFVWLDLSEFMAENTAEDEHKLWQTIYDETGFLLTPGAGFGHSKRGQFRLVYSFLQPDVMREAMDRLSNFVKLKRNIQK